MTVFRLIFTVVATCSSWLSTATSGLPGASWLP